ncbi:MAG: phosphoserine phosphatase SerB [Candidatus Verstraetearchaeota archaeon]|nr:phosphoserine phosphatase SerB [Candidatus Verstraetearchaeota archaeon]
MITVVGKDRPGIVAAVSGVLARFHANILKTRAATIFNDLFAMIMVVDTAHSTIGNGELINILKRSCDGIGLAVAAESCESYKCGKRIIVFDLDGTLIDQEVIEELAKAAGVGDEVKRITKLAMEGKIEFANALKERVRLLRGLPVSKLEEIKNSIVVLPGVVDLIRHLKSCGFVVGIVTGGFDFVADHVGKMIGADYVFSNKLLSREGYLTGEVEGDVTGPEAKLNAIRKIAQDLGVGLESCVAVGDGANDLFMIERVGLGVGFKAKLVVHEKAPAVINTSDIRVLLALIGCIDLKSDVIKRL